VKVISSKKKRNETSDKRARVLCITYQCSPYGGSEKGIGWNWVVEIAKYFDTFVICKQQRFEKDIRRWLTENGAIAGLHFYFVPRTRFEKLMKIIPGLFFIAYYLWHRRAYRLALSLHKEIHFHLSHQITLATFREPGFLWKLGVPFIWGPFGGSENYPWRFLLRAGFSGAIQEGTRNILNFLQLRSRRVRTAANRAAALIASNSTGAKDLARVQRIGSFQMLHVGVTELKEKVILEHRHGGPLRILWVGTFLHRKALHILLYALQRVSPAYPYQLKILGKGPLESRWRRLSTCLGVNKYCQWLGWVPPDRVKLEYDWADVLIFSSLRDQCGTVVTEALSRGVPLVCLDHQGVGDVITENCGIKIPVTTPDEVISRLRDAIVYLSNNPEKLHELSHGARERARDYLWSSNGKKMAEIYRQVLT
jgi:glycosyltransferase involved in cell wall biosynthesis